MSLIELIADHLNDMVRHLFKVMVSYVSETWKSMEPSYYKASRKSNDPCNKGTSTGKLSLGCLQLEFNYFFTSLAELEHEKK